MTHVSNLSNEEWRNVMRQVNADIRLQRQKQERAIMEKRFRQEYIQRMRDNAEAERKWNAHQDIIDGLLFALKKEI